MVEHLKVLALQHDLGPGDRFLFYATTGWMVWNLVTSSLLVSASSVIFDGNPVHPDLMNLWRIADETGATHLGASASFLMLCQKEGLQPGRELGLERLRFVASAGSPLPASGFRWVYEQFDRRRVFLTSGSGGSDVCSGFVGAVPVLPVYAGEMSGRQLGAKVEAYDPAGKPLIDEVGELVVTQPMPSMPVTLWNDADGERYRTAYFDMYPGVWRHGDWITITSRGTMIISGRSDATLNRGGVRLGASEFSAVVEALPEIADSLVVHIEAEGGVGLGELLLFVVPREGQVLDDALRQRIPTSYAGSSPRVTRRTRFTRSPRCLGP